MLRWVQGLSFLRNAVMRVSTTRSFAQEQFYKRKRLVRTCRLGFGLRNSVWRGTRTVLGSAWRVDGGVLVFFGGRMREEPGLLLFDHLCGLIVQVVDGFEGESAGDVVGFVVGRGLEVGRPALGGFDELGKDLADVAVAGAVVVKVVIELVGDGGELLEEIVGVLLATGFARTGE